MPRRIQKQQEKINDLHLYGQPSIPQGSKVAGYIRQSTKNQAESNHESAEMQAADVIRVASRLGVYDEACIIYFTENIGADGKLKNASGRLRIDQREGLAALVERIKTGEVKAVIVWREDRLFRDETLIQPLTFLALKKAREVLAALEKAQIKDDPLTEEEVDEYLYAVSDLENVWHKLPIEKQRKLVSKLCHRITIDKISTHWLMFSIHWVGIYGGEDVAYVWRDSGAMKAWTDDEVTILRDSYLTAPAQELLEQLPERTWHSITCAASELKLGRREKHQEPKIVNATSEDLEIMRNLGIEDQLKGVQALWMSQTNLAGSSAPSLSTVPRLNGSSARHRRIGRS